MPCSPSKANEGARRRCDGVERMPAVRRITPAAFGIAFARPVGVPSSSSGGKARAPLRCEHHSMSRNRSTPIHTSSCLEVV